LPSVKISEAGSSLIYPLFSAWQANFSAAYPSVSLNTAAGGSGLGQSEVEQGLIQIGGSDVALTSTSQGLYPCILDIPVAISAQSIDYNIPGLSPNVHLNFSGNILAGIYNGSITTWSNAAIVALQTNATVKTFLSSLSSAIVPIVRSDSSGDTAIFTQYLSDTSASWSSKVGTGTTVSWPALPGELAESGNSGMLKTVNSTQYSVAYVGVSYLRAATIDNHPMPLGYAYLQNQAGNFVNISTTNISYAVDNDTASLPHSEVTSLVYAAGADSYPIVNFEYALVSNTQTVTGEALALRTLYTWCITTGNSPFFLGPVNFVALPPTVAQDSLNQVAEINGP
jgi:phosphate transport system substrate-binding protein